MFISAVTWFSIWIKLFAFTSLDGFEDLKISKKWLMKAFSISVWLCTTLPLISYMLWMQFLFLLWFAQMWKYLVFLSLSLYQFLLALYLHLISYCSSITPNSSLSFLIIDASRLLYSSCRFFNISVFLSIFLSVSLNFWLLHLVIIPLHDFRSAWTFSIGLWIKFPSPLDLYDVSTVSIYILTCLISK